MKKMYFQFLATGWLQAWESSSEFTRAVYVSEINLFEFLQFFFQVEQLLAGQEDSQGNINYEEFVRTVMNG
jgi:hypothetical protein